MKASAVHTLPVVLAIAAALRGDDLRLRAGEAAPSGQVVKVDLNGVHLGAAPVEGRAPVETLVISWDRVASVGDAGAPFAAVAEQAWRARTRIERGDFISAEPLLEQLFVQYKSQRGATAAVVDEGLLRCRLRRGAHVLAIEPWLALLRATGAPKIPALHESWADEAGLPPVIDPATGLIPALPPIWLPWRAVESYARESLNPASGAPADPRVDALAAIYAQAARFETGLPASLAELATSDPGVNVAWQIVQARIGSPEQREAARKLLRDRLRTSPTVAGPAPWLEAWIRAGLGRSLIREDSAEQQQQGVIELLQIPARLARAHPYLAGMALAEASVALRKLNDGAGADALARELATLYPSHPVNDWPVIRAARPKSPQPSPTPSTTDLPPEPAEPPK